MEEKQYSKISIRLVAVFVLCIALFTASSARADQEDATCTNRSIYGDYGFAVEGVLIGVPGLPAEAPFRSVGVAHFDGKGHVTWLEHTVINGILLDHDWTTALGTYSVNGNCTGTAIVNTPNSRVPLTLGLVVVKDGKEVRTVLDANAISGTFIKVD
jgi:hypothetical protein